MRRLLFGLVVTATTALMPLAAQADNLEFAQQITQTLNSNRGTQLHGPYNIGVSYNNGTAGLKGTVASDADKAAAVAIVKQIPGVRDVADHLTVAPTLQPAAGTLAPEQVSRSTPSAGSYSTGETSPAAQRVASSFPPARVQAVGATEAQTPASEPTTRTVSVRPLPVAYAQSAPATAPVVAAQAAPVSGAPLPAYVTGQGGAVSPARYDQPHLPCYAWPTYSAYPNYAGVTYPKQYSPTAWPYIGPFYPYPQVPLGWRKVTLEWDDGWWMLDFKNHH